MADTIQCDTHGESAKTYVCIHLTGDSYAQGFNRNDPTDDNPFPDAWCDNCDLIFQQAGEWNDENMGLAQIQILCGGCYNASRIRNTIPDTTLDDLADLKWKCHTCEEWHSGPCLDFGAAKPDYWSEEHEKQHNKTRLLPSFGRKPKTWRDEDYAVCDDAHFFVRGVIHLPIIGSNETFRWGVWGSLSRDNFDRLMKVEEKDERVELGPMFSWLQTWIPEYGKDQEDVKMQAHLHPPGMRPHFEIEYTDHPLAQEYHHGIHPARVKEIMLNRLRKE